MKSIILTRSGVASGFCAVAILTSAPTILEAAEPSGAAEQSRVVEPSRFPQPRSASSSGELSSTDRSFLREAAEGGMAEVRMGELGQQKAGNSQVRELARRLEMDHKQANDELMNYAKAKGIELPTSMGATHQSALSELESKQSPEFDQLFVQQTIKDHRRDIAAFEEAADNLADPDFKAWAQKTIPVLKEHLQLAEAASRSLQQSGRSPMGR